MRTSLPLPPHYDPQRVGEVWRVPYSERAAEAKTWAAQHGLRPVGEDRFRVALLAIDVQNTFCIPNFELFVGGRSGLGAVEDNRRLCEFIYGNLDVITQIFPTMDTHLAAQIFHPLFFVNEKGDHPAPHTQITAEEIERGVWRFNPALGPTLGLDPAHVQAHLLHYTRTLAASGHYALTVWPYHAMLGGIGHALVASFEEAIFFHSVARSSQPAIQIKGNHPLTENYSAIEPEVRQDHLGNPIGAVNQKLLERLRTFDAILVAGEAKSHCVAWTVQDLLEHYQQSAPEQLKKIYLLVDCMSPVVVPGVVDYTEAAEAAFARFAAAGMHLVRSTDPIEQWLEGYA